MLDDHDAETDALGAVRAYDRREVEQYLALLHQEAADLHARLDAALARRERAEAALAQGAGASTGLSSAVHLALDALGRDEDAVASAIADLEDRSVHEARRLLTAAEREALVLRAAIRAALDELALAG